LSKHGEQGGSVGVEFCNAPNAAAESGGHILSRLVCFSEERRIIVESDLRFFELVLWLPLRVVEKIVREVIGGGGERGSAKVGDDEVGVVGVELDVSPDQLLLGINLVHD